MRVRFCLVIGTLIGVVTPTLAGAWPAALTSGTPVRLTVPALADTPITGTFLRHDDAGLVFRPDRSRHEQYSRFHDIARLEVDMAPVRLSNRTTRNLAVLGALSGFGFGAGVAGGLSGSLAIGMVWGAALLVPGALIGGFVGGLLGGTGAALTRDAAWEPIPRERWTTDTGGSVKDVADTTSSSQHDTIR